MRTRFRLSAVLLLASAGTAAAQSGTFRAFPPGSNAYGLSPDGQTVLGRDGSGNAFRSTLTGPLTILGPGTAKRITADGTVIMGNVGSNVFRWTQSGTTIIGAGDLQGMSRDGSAAAGLQFQWSSAGGYGSLPSLPSGGAGQNRYAWAISGDGSTIVGSSTWFPGGAAPVRWTSAGALSLGAIPGGTSDAVGSAVSHDGSIIYGMGLGPTGYDTFRWTEATGMVGLGVTGPGFSAPLPLACTPDGGILVGNAVFRAFVWTMGAGPESVQDLLENVYGLDLGGLQLVSVNAISDDGTVIAGYGEGPGGSRG